MSLEKTKAFGKRKTHAHLFFVRYNLSAPAQFRSKEITKTNVVDDMVASNSILYAPGEHPDHLVVIKYGCVSKKDSS